MRNAHPTASEVDHLLLNAQLRDALEPYQDESLMLLDRQGLSTAQENEYLAAMLAWERAPILPIARWCEPELTLPRLDALSDREVAELLWDTVHKLYAARVALHYTDHLSDRQLLGRIQRDILPSEQKRLDAADFEVRWHFASPDDEPETWLRYYASAFERAEWAAETGAKPPPKQAPPHPRRMPGG